MKKTGKFKNHFINSWPLYAVWLVVSIIIGYWVCDGITSPNMNETITVYFAEYSNSCGTIETDLDNEKELPIREVNVLSAIYGSSNYGELYQAYGTVQADFIVIPESQISSNSYITGSFASMDVEAFKEFTNDTYSFLTCEIENTTLTYGIKVHAKDGSVDYFKDNITFTYTDEEDNIIDEDFYLFINLNSCHLKKNKDGKDDLAYEYIVKLINLGKKDN